MNERVSISVIVPVYNVSDYLMDCLNSIDNQTFKNFELILIDDGSTDNSLDLLKDFASTHSYAKVYPMENQGLSAARNAGLMIAKGDYVCFVDSDDVIEAFYLEALYNAAINNRDADLVIGNFYNFGADGKEVSGTETGAVRETSKKEMLELLSTTGANINATASVVAWNKLIKRELAMSHEFLEGIVHEDEQWIMPLILDCKKVVWIDKMIYGHRIRQGSIIHDTKEGYESAVKHLTVLDSYEKRCRLLACDKCDDLRDRELRAKMNLAYYENIRLWYGMLRRNYLLSRKDAYNLIARRADKAFLGLIGYVSLKQVGKALYFLMMPESFLRRYWD